MTLSNEVASEVLAELFIDAPTFLSLHTSSPIAGGLATAELTAPAYARQPVLWKPAGSRAVTNAADLNFGGLPRATVRYLGVMSDVFTGRLIAELACDPAYETSTNGSAIFIPRETIVIELV